MTDHPPERRSRERRKHAHPRDPVARCLIVLLAGIVALGAGWTAKNRSDYLTLKEGRRVGAAATCPLIVAVIDAGGNVIAGGENAGLLPGDQFVRGRFVPGPLTDLLGPTYPGYERRKLLAAQAAKAYKSEIADALAENLRKAGVENAPLTGDDISCKKYAVIVKAR